MVERPREEKTKQTNEEKSRFERFRVLVGSAHKRQRLQLSRRGFRRARSRESIDIMYVVQVGAHDHHGGSHDVVPQLIQKGWRALLIEPQPNNVAKLRTMYQNVSDRVRIEEAAICANKSQSSITLWYMNGTATLGSNHSDVRCLGRDTFVTAIASLNRAHVQRFQGYYYSTPKACRRCAAKLNRSLPSNCMRHVFNHNIKERSVRCASVVDLIYAYQHGPPDMLMIECAPRLTSNKLLASACRTS
eukprot:7103207-Prymnesium_polylepis.1